MFQYDWHSWLSHYIIFQIRKENELTDQKFMLSFVWLFSFLTNQKNNAVLQPRKEHFRGFVGFEAQAKERRPRGQGRPGGLPTLVDSVEQEREQEVFIELDDFDDCIEENTNFLTD